MLNQLNAAKENVEKVKVKVHLQAKVSKKEENA